MPDVTKKDLQALQTYVDKQIAGVKKQIDAVQAELCQKIEAASKEAAKANDVLLKELTTAINGPGRTLPS